MCNTQNSLLLNQHNGDDAPQDYGQLISNIFGGHYGMMHCDMFRPLYKGIIRHYKVLSERKLTYDIMNIYIYIYYVFFF